jgi:hypothetical protein
LISRFIDVAYGIWNKAAYVRNQKMKCLDNTYFDSAIITVIAQQHSARAQALVSGTVAAAPDPSPGLFWLTCPVDLNVAFAPLGLFASSGRGIN